MAPPTYRPDGKTLLAAVTTVAAVYVYFLIFAQFGFLHAVQAAFGDDPGMLRPFMATMGLAGVTGSVVAAWGFAEPRSRRWLAAGFVLCGAAAGRSMGARSAAGFHAVALLTGLGTGVTTVTLAAILRRAVGETRLGLVIGLGTGLAYGFCNLPAVFAAGAPAQALLALLAATVGLAGGSWLAPRLAMEAPGLGDYSRGGVAVWVTVFFALVCVDSAAFYVIQHTPELKSGTWTGGAQLLLNAAAHIAAGALAGVALDRGRLAGVVLMATTLLLVAGGLIATGRGFFGAPLYAASVSVYSAALVFYPASSGRPGRAALVYAVAGWGASGLGIALAEGRHTLPAGLGLIAAGVIGLALFWRNRLVRRAS
jgi:hypothetical protein